MNTSNVSVLQFSEEDESFMKRMEGITKEVAQSEKKLSDVIHEIDGIHRVRTK